MKVTNYKLIHEAFGTVDKQIHAHVDGIYYRIFGEGESRRVRQQIGERSPLVKSKKLVREILAAVDTHVAGV